MSSMTDIVFLLLIFFLVTSTLVNPNALNLDDKDETTLVGQKQISLGTVLISFEKAEEQAKDYGHSLIREFSFLFVHGLLHLLGYDHMTEEDEEEMFALQDEILGGRK